MMLFRREMGWNWGNWGFCPPNAREENINGSCGASMVVMPVQIILAIFYFPSHLFVYFQLTSSIVVKFTWRHTLNVISVEVKTQRVG